MKQKIREIMRAILSRKELNLQKNTTSAPKHMPKGTTPQSFQEWKQETFWNQ